MEENPAIHERSYLVHSYEADVRGRARPGVLYAYLLDIAWSHVRSTAFDFQTLDEKGRFWVVSRFSARFDRVPRWDETITVTTWGSGTDRLHALRDYVVRSAGGEQIAEATSAWLILDRKTLRPQRLDELRELFAFANPERKHACVLAKLPALSAGQLKARFPVRFTDLDVNRHVNATRYLGWMLDSFDDEVLSGQDLRSMELNYLAEGRLGDEIEVTVEAAGAAYLCAVTRVSDGRELCRARLQWGA